MHRMKIIIATAAIALGLGLTGCESTGMFSSRDQIVAAPASCAPQRFEIYFAEGQAQLTDSAKQAISMTAAQVEGCNIRSVQVLGLADAQGGADANLTLSERRARTTAEALVQAGLPIPAFSVAAVGDMGATTPEGLREPLRRRTEVVIDAVSR